MIERLNKDLKRIKTFNQMRLLKIGSISRIMDKKTKLINKLFKDLNRMANPLESKIDIDLYKEREKFNKTDIVNNNNKNKPKTASTKKKLKENKKKRMKYNFSFNKKRATPINNIRNNNNEKFSFITSPLETNKIHYYKINPINKEKSKIYIDYNTNDKNLFKRKLVHNQKFKYKTKQNKFNRNKSLDECKSEEIFQKNFPTCLKTFTHFNKNNYFDKMKLNKMKKIRTQQCFYKHLSSKVLDEHINNSSNIFNSQYNKYLEEEKNISTTINNIKSMIEKNEEYKSYENKMNALINKDIDIPHIRKNMKLFKRGLKGKIIIKTNDIFNSSMVTKKVADIINYWDNCFSKMNDIFFYRNKNAFYKMYPPLSFKAREDPFIKNYALINYNTEQKNKTKIKNDISFKRKIKSKIY